MSCDNTVPKFEIILSDEKTNAIIEALIRDQAFSIEFIATCVAHYYDTVLLKEKRGT